MSNAIAPTPATKTQYLRSHPPGKMRALNLAVFQECIGADTDLQSNVDRLAFGGMGKSSP